VTAGEVFLQGDVGAGTELVDDLPEKGVTDGLFTLHHGVVVIQDQAAVFQHSVLLRFSFSIANMGSSDNIKIILAITERMYYNIEKRRRWPQWSRGFARWM
jgi:hypothetical protein